MYNERIHLINIMKKYAFVLGQLNIPFLFSCLGRFLIAIIKNVVMISAN